MTMTVVRWRRGRDEWDIHCISYTLDDWLLRWICGVRGRAGGTMERDREGKRNKRHGKWVARCEEVRRLGTGGRFRYSTAILLSSWMSLIGFVRVIRDILFAEYLR